MSESSRNDNADVLARFVLYNGCANDLSHTKCDSVGALAEHIGTQILCYHHSRTLFSVLPLPEMKKKKSVSSENAGGIFIIGHFLCLTVTGANNVLLVNCTLMQFANVHLC